MPIRLIEPVEYTSNLEELLNLPKYEMGSDYQLSPELISSPSLENRIQPGTTPSTGYPDRYPKVDMPESELLNQYKRIHFMNRRKQQMQQNMQQIIRREEAATAAKQKAAADAAAAEQNRLAQSRRVIHDPGSGGGGGGGTWHGQTRAKEKAGVQVAGPGFGKGAYFADGGLVDLYRYGGF